MIISKDQAPSVAGWMGGVLHKWDRGSNPFNPQEMGWVGRDGWDNPICFVADNSVVTDEEDKPPLAYVKVQALVWERGEDPYYMEPLPDVVDGAFHSRSPRKGWVAKNTAGSMIAFISDGTPIYPEEGDVEGSRVLDLLIKTVRDYANQKCWSLYGFQRMGFKNHKLAQATLEKIGLASKKEVPSSQEEPETGDGVGEHELMRACVLKFSQFPVRIDHHACSVCGKKVAYVVDEGLNLFFDPACGCGPSPKGLEPVTWAKVAREISQQTHKEAFIEMAAGFGLDVTSRVGGRI